MESYSQLPEEHGAGWGYAESCLIESRHGEVKALSIRDWDRKILTLLNTYVNELIPKWQGAVRIEALEKEIADLKGRCELLERLSPILVPIETLTPEPYIIKKPFHAVVRYQDDQYIASFFDANLSASGDTQMEAVLNLKDMVVSAFEMLSIMGEADLGPGPLQQKKVLGEFIRKK